MQFETICHHSTQFCTNLWCIAIYALHKKKQSKFGTIQLIVAQSVTPKYHHKVSCFYFLFQCQKDFNLLCFFSTQIDHLNGLQTIIKLWTSESHSALWHNLAQFNSIHHPLHSWAQYGLVWHIIKAKYLNPITKNKSQFASILHRSTPYIPKFVLQDWFLCTKLSSVARIGWF